MQIAGDRSSTIVFPLPIDIVDALARGRSDGAARTGEAPRGK